MEGLQLPHTNLVQAEGRPLNFSLFESFIDWIDRGERTTQTYITNLRQFVAWMNYQGITAPQRQDIQAYREWLQTEHDGIQFDSVSGWVYRTDRAGKRVRVACKPATTAAYIGIVRQFFSWTACNGLYPDIAANIHSPKVSNRTHKKDAFKPSEVLEIERSIAAHAEAKTTAAETAHKDRAGREQRSTEQGKRLYAMFQLAVTAGLRTVEISRANVKDLETKGDQAWLYIWGKGHSEADQKKPIAKEVYAAIMDYLQSRTDNPTGASPLFVSTGNRSKGKRILATTIGTMLKKAMVEAGYNSERLTAHSLRHTAGTAVQSLTGDIYQTQQYMRHSDPKVTEIYLHCEDEQREAEIASRLYDLYHGRNTATAQIDPAMAECIAQLMNSTKAV